MKMKIRIIIPNPTNNPTIRELFQAYVVPPHCKASIKQITDLYVVNHDLPGGGRGYIRHKKESSIIINLIELLTEGKRGQWLMWNRQ